MFRYLQDLWWKATTSKWDKEKALDWIDGVRPLISFSNLVFDAGNLAVDALMHDEPRLALFVEPNQQTACYLIAQLGDFFDEEISLQQTDAYELLKEADPGFRRIETLSIMWYPALSWQHDVPSPPESWKDPDYLYMWILANAVPRVTQVSDRIADEAWITVVHTHHWEYYRMVFWQGKSLRQVAKKKKRDDSYTAAFNENFLRTFYN
ncbi:hypothetical protein FHETE_5879 [Fusarium heterosporum]|uniref:Uncharacterized protein n=1 Tax=Fusarium heterosporum TaxID=42747 RepID=A0A8H5TCI2_FUSHE|nr:hypothetical protein FHETE_5879 [Fusarium heterosporum]